MKVDFSPIECPVCKRSMGTGESMSTVPPKSGDYGLCSKCGAFCIIEFVDEQMRFKEMNQQDIADLCGKDLGLFLTMKIAQLMIHRNNRIDEANKAKLN